MSDSDESGVTHTEISNPFEDLSDIGSPGVVGPEHEGLPWMLDDPYVQVALQALPSPDYIHGPEEPQSPPLPYFVLEPSSDYVPESDSEADPKEDDDEDPEEDPEDDRTSSCRLTVVAYQLADQVPTMRRQSRIEINDQRGGCQTSRYIYSTIITALLMVITTSPDTFSTTTPDTIPSLPSYSSVYRAAMIRLRAEAASTSHSLPLPPPIILSHTRPAAPSSGTPPLHLLSTNRESSSAAAARPAGGLRADYGFVATMDREIRRDPERERLDMGSPTPFETRVRRDTDKVYTRLDDEQSQRQLLASRLNMLFRDRRAHAHTARLMETEAKMSKEAWG
ncbi:hypothetical protein Tco_0010688 [Tanacetum coccineum]